MSYVLDTSVLLAITFSEPGSENVRPRISGGLMCSVNVTEVLTKYLDRGASEADALLSFQEFLLNVHDYDAHLAVQAGLLRSSTRHLGLSLGDRACLALALREKATVLTADRTWTKLDVGVGIEVIR